MSELTHLEIDPKDVSIAFVMFPPYFADTFDSPSFSLHKTLTDLLPDFWPLVHQVKPDIPLRFAMMNELDLGGAIKSFEKEGLLGGNSWGFAEIPLDLGPHSASEDVIIVGFCWKHPKASMVVLKPDSVIPPRDYESSKGSPRPAEDYKAATVSKGIRDVSAHNCETGIHPQALGLSLNIKLTSQVELNSLFKHYPDGTIDLVNRFVETNNPDMLKELVFRIFERYNESRRSLDSYESIKSSRLSSLKIDSLNLIEILVVIESTFNIKINDIDRTGIDTVEEFYEYVMSLLIKS